MEENGGKRACEVADDEFDRFAAACVDSMSDLDTEEEAVDGFSQNRRKIVRQILNDFKGLAMEENGGKIAYEVADDEFDRFAAAWDLDTDVDTMSEEDVDGFSQNSRKIVRQIMNGRAVVNVDGNIEYTLFSPVGTLESVELRRPGGRAYLAMDRAKEGKSVSKFNNLIGEAIKQPPTVISRMDGVDIKFLQAVYMLFLGS